MATCKNCIHYELCEEAYISECAELLNTDVDAIDRTKINMSECDSCEHFKDRSKFVELPCKVGAKIYRMIFRYDRNSRPAKKIPSHYLEEPVVGMHICDSRLRVNALSNKKYRDYIIVKCNNTNQLHHIPIAKIGKTVFLTKEEAEKALEERNGSK